MVSGSWVMLGAKIEPLERNHFEIPPREKIPVWIKEEEKFTGLVFPMAAVGQNHRLLHRCLNFNYSSAHEPAFCLSATMPLLLRFRFRRQDPRQAQPYVFRSQTLRRHLRTAHGLEPTEYRTRAACRARATGRGVLGFA